MSRLTARTALMTCLVLSAACAVFAATASAHTTTYAPKDCQRPEVRPTRIVLSCATFGAYVTTHRWESWHARKAKGRGYFHLNDCKPSCAEGHFHRYRVVERLLRPHRQPCNGRHVRMFSQARLRFPDKRPPHARFWHRGNKLFCTS